MTEPFSLKAPCPCGSGSTHGNCCAPFLSGNEWAASAEALMRSRYSAYATNNLDYVQRTWHPDTLPADLRLVPEQVWIGLKIKRTELGQAADKTGVVEFIARYKRNGRAKRMHETSQFEKINDRWLYVRGEYSAE